MVLNLNPRLALKTISGLNVQKHTDNKPKSTVEKIFMNSS